MVPRGEETCPWLGSDKASMGPKQQEPCIYLLCSRAEEVEETGDGLTPSFLKVQSRQEVTLPRVLVFGTAQLCMIATAEEETMGQTQTHGLGGQMPTGFLTASLLPVMQEARSHTESERWSEARCLRKVEQICTSRYSKRKSKLC